LAFSPEEVDLYTVQFNDILDYINRLKDVDLDNIEPAYYLQPLGNILREDCVLPGTAAMREAILREAPEQEDGFFKVPPVIE
ncbi:MAG TPA: Asp-tRNA(Asn)/Glu-tRNA(Gln) amidotransferase subunit GatB, partial [Firmicutes bacterium]|nr:Asp-tRNA(Asn)/Glu-tRNA(Gln) amidotransferase subunit GatB [Bacillota bacterium]